MRTSPSHRYRERIRYGCRVLASRAQEALLCGQTVSSLSMDDLEAYYELVFGYNPRGLAPKGYSTLR